MEFRAVSLPLLKEISNVFTFLRIEWTLITLSARNFPKSSRNLVNQQRHLPLNSAGVSWYRFPERCAEDEDQGYHF